MLNIPEEVKQLFRQSSTKKNIRIHFPNGEREDITNSNLISESFSFTESICSQDTLKFGLCEASMVEFETFGVGNIKDCTIEVTLEVPYNGETYPIPIGTFVVDSCEKQANLGRRNVVAYSEVFDFSKISALELAKRKQLIYTNRGYYDYDLFKFIAINYFSGNEDFLNKTLLQTIFSDSIDGRYGDGKNYWEWKINAQKYSINTKEELHSLYWINNNYNKTGVIDKALETLRNKLIEWNFYDDEGDIDSKIRYVKKHLNPMIATSSPIDVISLNDGTNYIYIYPYGETLLENYTFGIYIPHSLDITFNHYLGAVDKVTVELNPNPELYLVDTSSWSQYTNVEKGYFVNKLPNTRELTKSYFELNGLLGKIGREGAVDLISLKPKLGLYPSETLYPAENLYPRGMENLLTKPMYEHPVWYDDTYTLPYSKVVCTYKNSDTNENTLAEYDIVEVEEGEESNYQTYDLSDNYLIKNNTFTESEITAILETFASNVEGIKYMPAEINTVGAFPYLEAGDVVQVITTDGGFETIILNRTLSGMQSLSDSYESRG